jgi:hypothetical protein
MRSAVAVVLSSALLLCCAGAKTATTFNPTNEIKKDQKCLPVRADLVSERVAQVLKSDVIAAIEKQITDANTEKKDLNPVKVRVFLVSLEEFTQELKDDGNKDLAGRAQALFDKYDAYTYAPNKDKDTVKIKIFCKNAIQDNIGENETNHGFDRKLVHELVDAKVIAMGDVGEKPPFPEGEMNGDPPPKDHKEDHNGKFSKEVDDLMKKLPN